MKTRQQLLIDRLLAKPLAYLLNFLVRFAGRIFNIDHSLNQTFKTIAICKFKGMGSIIQSTPMIQTLRKIYPDSEIIFVTTNSNRELLTCISDISTIITIDDSGVFRLIKTSISALLRLIKKKIQVYIDLEIYSNFSTLFTTLTLSKNRIGFYLSSSSFRMGIYTHMMFFNTKVPVSQVYMQIARLFNAECETPPLFPLNKTLEESSIVIDKPYVVINPNASDLRIERRWEKMKFAELIQKIRINFSSYKVVLIGSKHEISYTQEICELLEEHEVINLAGKTTFMELVSLIENARLLITNDTGPMHIAFSCNTPSVCLFGPCSPEQYGNTTGTAIIYKRVYCSPCVHDFQVPPCKGNNVCMKLIEVEEVWSCVNEMLTNNITGKQNTEIYFTFEKETLGLVNRQKIPHEK